MSLNSTPLADRIHIGFFGSANAGKSSLVNRVIGQEQSIVSEIKGTTTDPVYKTMELLPLGPVVIIDTPGIDDTGDLGNMRVDKAMQVLRKIDIAILVVDVTEGRNSYDNKLLEAFNKREIPFIIAYNKEDLLEEKIELAENEILVSATLGKNIEELKEKIAKKTIELKPEKPIISDLLEPGDIVVLVIPIDESAPKGRLILPQQQTIRDILDIGAIAVVSKESELKDTIDRLERKPKLVITDSQVFHKVNEIVTSDIYLTSFSILLARKKGLLDRVIENVKKLKELEDGDNILVSEGCTHHRQCNDIGTVKIPNWVNKYTGKKLNFSFTSGGEFPNNLSKYKFIIHCGGCMLNDREMKERQRQATLQDVPITNYGILIATMNGILERSLEIFNT